MKKITLTYSEWSEEDNQCVDVSMELPARNQICDNCEGDGKVDHPAFSNGITQSDREEMGEEDFHSYMSGAYDVACDCCKGRGIVVVADVSQMTFLQKRFIVKYRKDQKEQAEYERQSAAEQRAEMNFGRGYFA